MKKNLAFIFILILLVAFSACTTTRNAEPRERSDTFIADVNMFDVGSVHLYTNVNLGKPKISDLYITFAPRTNWIYVTGRIGIDKVRLGFSYEDRKILDQARQIYLDAYEQGTIKDQKPTKKNAWTTGQVKVDWGVTGTAHSVVTTFMTNAKYLEQNKPYFCILLNSKEEKDNEHVYSPKISIYISPSQWETLMDLCNQAHLEAMTDEILEEANAF